MSERKDIIQDMTEAYVLGGLEEAEIAEYEAYLQEDIDEQLRVAALRDTVGLLASTAAPISPPTGMKSRILANVLKGSESTSDTSRGTTERTVGQPIDEPKSADISGEPAKRQGEIEAGGATNDGPRLEDGGTERLLEQARQGIEAGEARRAAETLGNVAAADEAAPKLHEVQSSSDGDIAHARTQSGEAPIGAAEIRASDSVESVRQAREATRARSGRTLWAGAAAIMAAAAVLLGVYSAQLRGELNDMRSDMTAMQQQTTALAQHASDMEQRAADMEQQLNTVKGPAVDAKVDRTVALAGMEDDPQAWGTASMVRDDVGTHLLVQAAELPALSGSEAYQVWLIDKEGNPINAGTFKADDGNGALSYMMQPGDYQMVAITLEPDAEGDQPRGRKVLVGALNG